MSEKTNAGGRDKYLFVFRDDKADELIVQRRTTTTPLTRTGGSIRLPFPVLKTNKGILVCVQKVDQSKGELEGLKELTNQRAV